MSSNNNQNLNIDVLISNFRNYLDGTAIVDSNNEADLEFIKILKTEGDSLLTIYNNNSSENGINESLEQVIRVCGFDPETTTLNTFMIHDIFLLFKTFYHDFSLNDIPTRAKFILVYLYEKLKRLDLMDVFTLDNISQLVRNSSFEVAIEELRTTHLLNVPKNYSGEFLLPHIMYRVEEDLDRISHIYYRIASTIAKADGVISKEEKEILKQMAEKLNHSVSKEEINYLKFAPKDDTLEKTLEELNQLIGLAEVKKSIEELTGFLKVQKLREQEGLMVVDSSIHLVFMGPPGTGKTTVARLYGRLLKHFGYLSKGHLVETDRSGLVAGYIGQTAIKTNKIIDSALGGVLFIDEAYALVGSSDNSKDFGNEAIQVLLKRMEDERSDFVVIAAGYTGEMDIFMQSNPGLQSRFNRFFDFNHFDPQEMMSVFKLFTEKHSFSLNKDAQEKLMLIFEYLYENKDDSFGNGRFARNLFEQTVRIQSMRVVDITPITKEILCELKGEDIPPINTAIKNILKQAKV